MSTLEPNKKVVHARARGIPRNLPIFFNRDVTELNALQTAINNIFKNEILPLQQELKTIQTTAKAFRKSDVERIETIMETLKDAMIVLRREKETELKRLLAFPYELETESCEESSESDFSESEFERPAVLKQSWWKHLEQSNYWRDRIGLNAKEDDTLGDAKDVEHQDDEWERMRRCKCKRFEVFVPPKLLVVGPTGEAASKKLHPRLIFCDEPFEEPDDAARDKNQKEDNHGSNLKEKKLKPVV